MKAYRFKNSLCHYFDRPASYDDEPQLRKCSSPHRERDYRFFPERNTPLFLKLLLITIVAMGARDAFPIPLRSFIYAVAITPCIQVATI